VALKRNCGRLMSGHWVEAAPVYASEGNIIDGQVRRDGPGRAGAMLLEFVTAD
jgi:hypothetical protein